ncbi:MAG: alkaline phosphatase family protein [Alphaproteobacteria bacterium]|nr:MAG: alkaline phosphatase family protein [Alphaproteobacteria bacterium]
MIGPLLAFRGCENQIWNVSILVVIDRDKNETPPILGRPNLQPLNPPQPFAKILNYEFIRFKLQIIQTDQQQNIAYTINNQEYTFIVPAAGQNPHILYTSCNRYDEERWVETNGFQANWKTIVTQHKQAPFHINLGGGDQVYADDVLEIPIVRTNIKKSALTVEEIKELDETILNFYIKLYISYISQPFYKDILASIPALNMLDDHEIFNNAGITTEFANNPLCKILFDHAYEIYMIFQNHTTTTEAKSLGYFGPNGRKNFSILRKAGDVYILGMDIRGDISKQSILPEDARMLILDKLNTIPETATHLLIMSSIPIVFPEIRVLTRIVDSDTSKLQMPSLSDLVGLWGSYLLFEERDAFIQDILTFAKTRKEQNKPLRITFLAGDTHMASAGVVYKYKHTPFYKNPEYILQLTSSGVGSTFGKTRASQSYSQFFVLDALQFFFQKKTRAESNKNIKMQMLHFDKKALLKIRNKNFFIAQRNWLTLRFADDKRKGITNIHATLFAEHINSDINKDKKPVQYVMDIPGLL